MPQIRFVEVACPNHARFGAHISEDRCLIQMWWRAKGHIVFEFRRRGGRAKYVRKFSLKSRMRDMSVRDEVYEEMLFRQAPGVFSANPLPAEVAEPATPRPRSEQTDRPGRQFAPRATPLFDNI